eukprot:GHVT01059389.1.p1 GENE.GHVT01059389.1~~GHVT01059389.1.p1  ORF type:complete len:158 (+),score=12.15 GHVT01059389.1:678-1151(+)
MAEELKAVEHQQSRNKPLNREHVGPGAFGMRRASLHDHSNLVNIKHDLQTQAKHIASGDDNISTLEPAPHCSSTSLQPSHFSVGGNSCYSATEQKKRRHSDMLENYLKVQETLRREQLLIDAKKQTPTFPGRRTSEPWFCFVDEKHQGKQKKSTRTR